MSDGPTIACVIPAHNREAIIGRAITSALEQTFPPTEVIVVDDGSSDGTADAARREGVTVLETPNGGAAVARNRGVEASSAEWIAFLDADDYWTPSHLAAIHDAIRETRGEADLYFADLERPGADGMIHQFDMCGFEIEGPWMCVEDAAPWVLCARVPMMLQASVVRRRAFDEIGGLWPELRRRHDTHLFIRLGIGRPACAVSNVGTIMTADDTHERLTSVMEPGSERYWGYSHMLWTDLVHKFPEADRAAGSPLRYRQFQAAWQLARRCLERFSPRGFVHLLQAFTLSPVLFAKSCVKKRPAEEDFVRRNLR